MPPAQSSAPAAQAQAQEVPEVQRPLAVIAQVNRLVKEAVIGAEGRGFRSGGGGGGGGAGGLKQKLTSQHAKRPRVRLGSCSCRSYL